MVMDLAAAPATTNSMPLEPVDALRFFPGWSVEDQV